ncbi:hypothetical protein [Streptomyces sp. PR69]|uniref:hypothetical protein n=1 Tax=Streptomyces sp. PR69 TaxID=2984950 RepID=UPI0022654A57|nr:hypothetical protein [Streptomyces sp. PR69]
MFDRLEIRVLPPGPRFAAQVRLWVNGKDVVEEAVGEGGRGPYAALPPRVRTHMPTEADLLRLTQSVLDEYP